MESHRETKCPVHSHLIAVGRLPLMAASYAGEVFTIKHIFSCYFLESLFISSVGTNKLDVTFS
jgi:hypothetical protein